VRIGLRIAATLSTGTQISTGITRTPNGNGGTQVRIARAPSRSVQVGATIASAMGMRVRMVLRILERMGVMMAA
jgi:hypothetical protein